MQGSAKSRLVIRGRPAVGRGKTGVAGLVRSWRGRPWWAVRGGLGLGLSTNGAEDRCKGIRGRPASMVWSVRGVSVRGVADLKRTEE